MRVLDDISSVMCICITGSWQGSGDYGGDYQKSDRKWVEIITGKEHLVLVSTSLGLRWWCV